MMGLFVTAVVVLVILVYVFKSIFEETDYQTWLNIALVSIILLTVVLSIFMILNKANERPSKPAVPPIKQEQPAPEKQKQESATEELSDEDLSVIIAENYLNIKNEYEASNNGEDGSTYAANKIIEEYDLTQEEWDDFYKKSVKNGYFKKAEENLKKKSPNYLIKTK